MSDPRWGREPVTIPLESKSCPFLGLPDDPDTTFSFPDPFHYCNKIRPPRPVRIEYQGTTCLAPEHTGCPAFTGFNYDTHWEKTALASNRGNFFPGLERGVLVVWILNFTLAGLFIICILTGQFNRLTGIFFTAELAALTQDTIVIPSSATATKEIVPTVPPPTSTPLHRSPTPGPELGTPFGPLLGSRGSYLIHEVQPGETLDRITEKYHTSLAVLAAANQKVHDYLTTEAFLARADVQIEGWHPMPGAVLVVLPWRTDSVGVRRFRTICLNQDMLIEELSNQEGVKIAIIQYYNGLGSQDMIPAGRWLILPENLQ